MLHDTFNNLLLQRSQAEKNKLQKNWITRSRAKFHNNLIRLKFNPKHSRQSIHMPNKPNRYVKSKIYY